MCVAALGMRSGTLCEVIFTQPPWLSNITGDIFNLPLPSVRISDLSY